MPRSRFHCAPLLVMAIAATIITEVFSGSTPLSRIGTLPAQLLIYGSAAILIRETTRRLHAGWFTILLMGLAFGICLEGPVLQSLFNPNFLGNNISLGRAMGVNWVWAAYMPAFHSFAGITSSILFTELCFHKHRNDPWGGRILLWVLGIILVLFCCFVHKLFVQQLAHFDAAPVYFVVSILVAALLVIAAVRFRRKAPLLQVPVIKPRYAFAAIVLATFAAVALWCAGFLMIFTPHKPAPAVPILLVILVAVVYFSCMKNVRILRIYGNMDRLALLTGLLPSIWLLGYFSTQGNARDHQFHFFWLLPIAAVILLLYRKFRSRAL